MLTWQFDPSVVLGILVFVGFYFVAIGPRRSRFGRSATPVSRGRQALFVVAMVTLYLALQSPLDTLADGYLFSAHMLQHMLLSYVVPPLILVSFPSWLVGSLIREARLLGVARWVVWPPVALLAFNILFAAVHIPVIYELILHHQLFHIASHLAFIAAGVVTLWPLLSRTDELPALNYPRRLLYCFAQAVAGNFLGAVLTLANDVLYRTYETAPRIFALSARDDQLIGGLLMWIGGFFYFFFATTIVFFLWASKEESEYGLPELRPGVGAPH